MRDRSRKARTTTAIRHNGPTVRESFPLFCGLVNQNAPTVDPETALVMPEFDAEDDSVKDDLRGRGGSSHQAPYDAENPETAGAQAIRSALDETMIDVLARNPEFQTIDPRMVRWSF
jgi:hypothetical protein